MTTKRVREMVPDGAIRKPSDIALAMFGQVAAKSPRELRSQARDYQRLSISALTMCCTCD